MKKLKLNLDEIKVESFETVTKKENPVGTVIGYLKEPAPTEGTCENCGSLGMCTYQMWICFPNTAPGVWDTCYSPEC
ncbi:MAG: pinensin family lanthipeptide [Melioribacteraceae bacterium]